MLLFIKEDARRRKEDDFVSIHHMLLFIDTSTSPTGVKLKFQYITCYSLSALIGLAHPLFHRFNTSHVTLYPRWKLRNNFDVEFQYITCYSLSARRYKTAKGIDVSIHHMLLFIPRFIEILSIHMSNNTPKPKEFQYFYQALLEILYF